MKFKIKAIKSGVWICGDTESSVKSGIRFLKDLNQYTQFMEIQKTDKIGTDEAYESRVILS